MASHTAADARDALTRYLIFETDEQGVDLHRIGDQLARGSDEALRKFFSEPLRENDGYYVAISENSFKLRKAVATVKTTLSNLDLPPVPMQEPLEGVPTR